MAGDRQTGPDAETKHPLTGRPAKFRDIPERVHRDAYWLALQKQAKAEAERDACKAALERLMEAAKAIRWCVSDPYSHDTDITVEGDSWRAFRSVLAGESSTTEE